MHRTFLYAASLLLLISVGESARILAIFAIPMKSHFNSYSQLLEELAKRGHEVTAVSAFPRSTPLKNYKDIVIEDHIGFSENMNLFERREVNMLLTIFFMGRMFINNCDRFLSDPPIQELIRGDQQFDLIIYQSLWSECAYGFVHKFNAPFIQVSPNSIQYWMGDGVGNPHLLSYIPELLLGLTDHMSFGQRLHNLFYGVSMAFFRSWVLVPNMESVMRKHFPDPALPGIRELEANSSFFFLNTHVSFNYPRPLTPNTAEVGGTHIKEPKALPTDLQKFLDDAEHGVIYFSLGSHIRSSRMPEAIRIQILKAFSQLKQKVLWKWETDTLPGQPENVRIEKWLPQNDILAHPNVRAFITHGGLLSIQEALHHGMPLVAVPVFGDQPVNSRQAHRLGCAVVLDLHNITTESLQWAVNEVLHNPSYVENAKRLSRIAKDQPEKPLERAAFWVEYVIRHKGAPHMKSAALDLNFVQYYVLDVIAVVLSASLAVFVITVVSCRALLRRITHRHNRVSKSKKVK